VIKPLYRLTFRDKLKWTGLILLIYFILGVITVWGINPAAVARFEFLEIVFGAKFGSLITLGIGPIVTASIILQLLVGSKLLPWDMTTREGKIKFMGSQKILAILFCFFEASAFVLAGAVPPAAPALAWIVILQLAAGGILIIFMDEVCSKWGFGSGVSLFIAAGVSKTIIVRIFSPFMEAGGYTGVLASFGSLLAAGQPDHAFVTMLPLISTVVVFLIVVFAQAMRIEIPMAFAFPFGKFAARRWPLRFIYTSNIPVILTAAVLANLQIIGQMLAARGIPWLGEYGPEGVPVSGLMYLLTPPVSLLAVAAIAGVCALLFVLFAIKILGRWPLRMAVLGAVIGAVLGWALSITYLAAALPAIKGIDIIRAIVYMAFMVAGATIFSIFWVNTAGMDAKTVAEQFKSSAITIPGFRHDPRIIERVLQRYIPVLAVLGGAFVGFLAGFADLTSAIGTGTGILLTVMIIYQFYESIAAQHLEDMHPALRRFMGG
jgi:preprotein translocase subunit SecY